MFLHGGDSSATLDRPSRRSGDRQLSLNEVFLNLQDPSSRPRRIDRIMQGLSPETPINSVLPTSAISATSQRPAPFQGDGDRKSTAFREVREEPEGQRLLCPQRFLLYSLIWFSLASGHAHGQALGSTIRSGLGEEPGQAKEDSGTRTRKRASDQDPIRVRRCPATADVTSFTGIGCSSVENVRRTCLIPYLARNVCHSHLPSPLVLGVFAGWSEPRFHATQETRSSKTECGWTGRYAGDEWVYQCPVGFRPSVDKKLASDDHHVSRSTRESATVTSIGFFDLPFSVGFSRPIHILTETARLTFPTSIRLFDPPLSIGFSLPTYFLAETSRLPLPTSVGLFDPPLPISFSFPTCVLTEASCVPAAKSAGG